MKNTIKLIGIIALVAIVGFSMAACTGGGGGGKSINSADELKAYLDSQPANSPDVTHPLVWQEFTFSLAKRQIFACFSLFFCVLLCWNHSAKTGQSDCAVTAERSALIFALRSAA